MKLFDVYPLFDIEPVKALDVKVYDKKGTEYLDLYGGHAVISVGHAHPHYVKTIQDQLEKIAFYSNSVQNSLQKELAEKLGEISGYQDYDLFLTNSGAEANENALKLASFYNGRKKVLAFKKGFHGRTSAAVAVTDNPNIVAPVNSGHEVVIIELNDAEAAKIELQKGDFSAVIIEGIQGIGGIYEPDESFLKVLRQLCSETNTVLILDEIQSGYGRSGKFFAHQYPGLKPDVITVAKGMGNGFPIGGVLISPRFEPKYGMLGTTFGGNHLACAAGISVLDIIKNEKLVDNAAHIGSFLIGELTKLKGVKEIRGKGLMIGIEMDYEIQQIRKNLLFENHIFTGVSGKNVIRLLPPLTLKKVHAEQFLYSFENQLKKA